MKNHKVVIEFKTLSYNKEETRQTIEEKIIPSIYQIVWNVNSVEKWQPITFTIEEVQDESNLH